MIERHMERLRAANRWSSEAVARVTSADAFMTAGVGHGARGGPAGSGVLAGGAAGGGGGLIGGAAGAAVFRPDERAGGAAEVVRRSDELHAELRREAAEVLGLMDALLADRAGERHAAVEDARRWWAGHVARLAELDAPPR